MQNKSKRICKQGKVKKTPPISITKNFSRGRRMKRKHFEPAPIPSPIPLPWECLKCGFKWSSMRKSDISGPNVCPNCHSHTWDIPYDGRHFPRRIPKQPQSTPLNSASIITNSSWPPILDLSAPSWSLLSPNPDKNHTDGLILNIYLKLLDRIH